MIRLLKEVFRSLSKNKITVIGLTILIFITCGLFTLLFDIKKSYTSTLNDYKAVSKMQDLTVNLDVNPNGEVPNGGYNQVNEEGLIDTKPTIYTPDPTNKAYTQTSRILNVPEKELNYLNIKNFRLNNNSLVSEDTYIDSSIFQKWFFDNEKNQGIAIFNMNNGTFQLTHDTYLPIFSQTDKGFEKITEDVVITADDIFTFDKEYSLKDIANIVNTPKGTTHYKLDDYAMQPLNLFLNVQTKEASFDTHKLELWSLAGDVIVISGEDVLNQLGFINNKNKFYFDNKISQHDLSFVDENNISQKNINENIKIKSNFSLSNYFKKSNISKIHSKLYKTYKFQQNVTYQFPRNWIKNIEISSEFEKRTFKLNWDYNTENNSSNWKGSYLSYITKVYLDNNKKIPDDIREFSFWTKSVKTRWYLDTETPKSWNVSKEPISLDDLSVVLVEKNSEPTSTDKDTIAEIENIDLTDNATKIKAKFNEISNTNLLQLKRNNIAAGANNVARHAIIKEVINKVGEEHVGLRQSLTVETINEDTSNKNIFHFVNTGDQNNSIRGVNQNVGKLYDEAYSPTILNAESSEKNLEEYLLVPDKNFPNRKTKLPSVYAKNIIDYIFKGYTSSPKYLDIDIRFEPFYNYYPGTQIPHLTNAKIMVLISEDEDNNRVQYAITKSEENSEKGETRYIVLAKKEINNQLYWTKLLIPEHNSSLSLDELDNFLIQHKLTIKAKIGKEGWAKVDSKYKNNISLPFAYGAIDNAAVIDITQNNSINILIKQIKQTILKTDLSQLFTEEQLDKILLSGQIAVERNQFHNLLAAGKTNNVILKVVLFDWMYEMTKPTKQANGKVINFNINTFWSTIVNNIINFVKDKYKYTKDHNLRSLEEQKNYLKEQFNKLEELIMNLTGSTTPLLNNIILGFKISDMIEYIKDYDTFLDSISKILTSIDLLKFSELANKWYKDHPYKPYLNTSSNYYTLSSDEISSFLFQSLDEIKLKQALNTLVNGIDFKLLLSPESSISIYSKIISAAKNANKIISEQDKSKLIALFNKFNAYEDETKAFQNINDALNTLINSFSLKTFNENLIYFLNKSEQKEPVNANGVIFENNYVKRLKPSNWVASFISGLSQIKANNSNTFGKIKTIQESLKLLANLSSATQNAAGLYIPASDDKKLTFNDLGSLNLIRFPENNVNKVINKTIDQYDIDRIELLKNKVENAVLSKKTLLKFTIEESNFLKNIALVTNEEFSDLSKVLFKLNNYLNLVSKLTLNNYQNKSNPYNLNFNADAQQEVLSYGDLAYRSVLFNDDKTDVEANKVLHFIYNQLKSVVGDLLPKNVNGFISQELVLYSFWIQLTYELKSLNPSLSLEEIKNIIVSLYEFMTSNSVAELLRQYKEVDNQIPSYSSILGSDLNNYATILKISKGLANNITSSREFKNSNLLETLKQLLENKNLATHWDILKQLLDKNLYHFVLMMSMLNESEIMPTHFKESQKTFINNFINAPDNSKIGSLITNDYELNVLYLHTLSSVKVSKIVNITGISPIAINPLLALSFPQVLLYTAISDQENKGNLAYLVSRISRDLETISIDELDTLVNPLFDSVPSERGTTNNGDKNIVLDISYFSWLKNKFVLKDKSDQSIFGLNPSSLFEEILFSLVSDVLVYNIVSYNDTSAYLAKINYAYLTKNKKEVYQGNIEEYLKDPFKMTVFISSLDEKYKIKVNSIEYLIIGIDTTADYLYPVINEENLQVDTSNQALVYVNSKGFDRIKSAYPTFALKEYLLVQKGDFKAEELKQEFSSFISSIASNITEKVYLANELDPINPEISIRITLIQKIIKTIGNVQIFSLIILISLVSLSLYFIIRRYINDRNKVIGILRSQGYRSSEISFAFSSFVWLSTIIGSISGYILGHFIQPLAFNVFSSYWTLPTHEISFNWLTLVNTFIVPFAILSLLIYIITMFSIRIKPIEQMSGLSEISVGKISQKIAVLFRILPIKSRFVSMLTLNNFWKLFSLFISFAITSLITMFSLSSLNVFQKSIQRTYQHRNYKFKLDIETPTIEGGPYVLYDKNNLNDLLYVPDDLSASSQGGSKNQIDYNSPFYFKPGYSYNTDVINKPFAPPVLTKSSLDILLDTSVELSPWDVVFASLPETQKARIIEIFKNVSFKMFRTQNLHYYNQPINNISPQSINIDQLYATETEDPNSPKTSYFIFSQASAENQSVKSAASLGRFLFVEYDSFNLYYKKPITIKTDKVRLLYRNFLVSAYKKIDKNDFFMSFGGMIWNNDTNEKYSYAKTTINNQNINIYGYKKDSKFIELKSNKNKDLSEILYKDFNKDNPLPENLENITLPLVINNVVAKKWNLKEGSTLQFTILNNVDRFVNKVLNIKNADTNTYTFKVVGINETYINNEFITTKEIVDRITGLDKLSNWIKSARHEELELLIKQDPANKLEYENWFNNQYEAFNGILSNDSAPEQTINTLTTYSSSGYWGAIQTYNANTADDKSITDFFKKIFVGQNNVEPMFKHTVDSYNKTHNTNFDYREKLKEFLNVTNDEYKTWGDSSFLNEPIVPEIKKSMVNAINKLYGLENSIYGKDILYAASQSVDSKDIEAGFINGIAKTITNITLSFIVISFIVSIIILIMITNLMINLNRESIATFSILGYSNKEKVFLFFFYYIPIILLASLLMIPITYLLIISFNAFMMATSQMILPLYLYYSTILISILVSLLVFGVTSIFAWISLNKIKPVYLLKGK